MKRLGFMGFFMPMDGYGYATIKIAEALEALTPGPSPRGRGEAVEVTIADMRDEGGRFGKAGDRRWVMNGVDAAVALCTPDWLPSIKVERLIVYTMFEASRLPEGWVEKINAHTALCLVPSQWCREIFIENGVRVPVEVVRWGVDPGDYWLLNRDDHEGRPYTFLWSGTPDRRKGWDVVYRAFWQAFGKREDVRLVMHFRRMPKGVSGCDDENVKIVEGMFGRSALREMLRRADCFVFPSRGEGWGLPPREAAATGLPVIGTNFGGLTEEIKEWALPLDVRGMSQAEYGFWDEVGEWCEPDVDHLVALMRWCCEHRAEAAAFGERAADWIAQNATWERTAKRIIDLVEGEQGIGE